MKSIAGLTDEQRFLADVCPLCGSDVHRVVREGADILFPTERRFRALECGHCGAWFTQGSDFASVSEYYERSYPSAYYDHFSGGRDGDLGSNPRLAGVLGRVLRTSESRRVLDVGCGNGGFPNYLRTLGFDASGLEVSAQASAYARSTYGLRVFNGQIEDLATTEVFDAITMVGTVEHLLNPLRSLSAARSHLVDAGYLIFDFPVVDCLESRLARERWWGLDLPRHTLHLTYATARALVERVGFRLEGIAPVVTTWFHYGFVSPPLPGGHPRRSLSGAAFMAIAASLVLTRRSPLAIAVCRREDQG
jgi:SAM-dependent methyltransferase